MKKEEQIIKGFRDLLNKLVLLNKFKMEKSLKGYKSSEVHCIEYIGQTVNPNVTKLAEAFYMTRGAISKLTKKLIKKGLIESYKSKDNKKEIYFRLTEQGKKIYKIHEKLHREFHERDKIIFDEISEEQFNNILTFVDKYTKHLDEEIKKQDISMKSE